MFVRQDISHVLLSISKMTCRPAIKPDVNAE